MTFTNRIQNGYIKRSGNNTIENIFDTFELYFAKCGNGFFKFTEPCQHRLYRKGDSWCEVIGVSAKTFRKYLKQLCATYASKADFQNVDDPFVGKPFASYFDRLKKITYFFRNPSLKGDKRELFEGVKSDVVIDSLDHHSRSLSRSLSRSNNKVNKTNIHNLPPKSSFKETEQSLTKREGDVEKIVCFKRSLKKEETSMKDTMIPQKAQDMRDIWVRETKSHVPTPKLSAHFAEKLLSALERFFGGCLERWKLFCRRCASSKWLMGEGSFSKTFKPWLIWIVKEKTIHAISQGEYGVDVSLPLVPPKKEADLLEEVRGEIEALEISKEEKTVRILLLQKVGAKRYRFLFESLKIQSFKDRLVFFTPGTYLRDRISLEYGSFLKDLSQSLFKKELLILEQGTLLKERFMDEVIKELGDDVYFESFSQARILHQERGGITILPEGESYFEAYKEHFLKSLKIICQKAFPETKVTVKERRESFAV